MAQLRTRFVHRNGGIASLRCIEENQFRIACGNRTPEIIYAGSPFCREVAECALVLVKNFSLKVEGSDNKSDMSYGRNECRIYVGNLPPDIRTKDIQDLFYKFGKVTFVDLKNRRGPPFAFVEFEDPR